MLETLTTERLVSDIFAMGRESSTISDLFTKFSARLREGLGIDQIMISDAYQGQIELSGLEEFVANTNKQYLDNRLSGYSAFPELIKHYNLGYRSCMMVPTSVEGKLVFVITLLSKQEDKFDNMVAGTASLASDILAYQTVAKVERERSVSLARYFDAAFNTYVPQFLIDKSGVIVRANKAVSGLFAKTQREMISKNISDFFNVDANALYALRDGTVAEVKDRVNESKVYKASCSKISERLTHVLLNDVTELKELEEKVRLAEKSPGEVFMLLAKDTTVLWSSANADKIMKISRDEIVGRRLIDLAYEDRDFANAISSVSDTYTKQLRMNVGNDVVVDLKATLAKNQFGGFSCLLASNNFEKYITNIQNTVSELVESSSDAIISVDALGYVKSTNRSAERLLRYNKSEISGGQLVALYVDAESQERVANSLSLAKSRGVVGDTFVNMRVKDSEEPLPCTQVIRIMVDADNNPVGYMVIVKELATKIKMGEMQKGLEDLGKRLRESAAESQLKSEFLYNISHDLKTPLTNIRGYSKVLLESPGALTDSQRDYLNIVVSESDRLMQLILQILDAAKLSSGKITLAKQPVNFSDIAKNPTLETQKDLAMKKGLSFSWNVDYDVPVVEADPNRLIQVFVNLIGNAIKFTDKGGVEVRILRKGRSVRVEVIDTGIGISKEDKGKLFKKFYQLQRKGLTVQEGSGTGLGLVIAKEIVNLHGGKISVLSEPGRGSTFWFTLPISGKVKKPGAK